MTDLLTYGITATRNEAAGIWLTHKYKSQWALVVDVNDSWSTVGAGCTLRWDLSIQAEGSSLMGFIKLSF